MSSLAQPRFTPAHYRRLESLRDYVLIAQDKVRVEHYVRQGDQWVLSEASALSSTVHLSALNCEIILRDIYERVKFPSNDAGTSSRSGAV